MKDYEWQLIFPEIWGTLATYQTFKKRPVSDRHRKQKGKQMPQVTGKS